jgi:hypothetical protein
MNITFCKGNPYVHITGVKCTKGFYLLQNMYQDNTFFHQYEISHYIFGYPMSKYSFPILIKVYRFFSNFHFLFGTTESDELKT